MFCMLKRNVSLNYENPLFCPSSYFISLYLSDILIGRSTQIEKIKKIGELSGPIQHHEGKDLCIVFNLSFA